MVPKMFEPLKIECRSYGGLGLKSQPKDPKSVLRLLIGCKFFKGRICSTRSKFFLRLALFFNGCTPLGKFPASKKANRKARNVFPLISIHDWSARQVVFVKCLPSRAFVGKKMRFCMPKRRAFVWVACK